MFKAIPLDQIRTNAQARQSFAAIQELADSIATLGLLQPLVVREVVRDQLYELIAGERRLRALRLLQKQGQETALCRVLPVDLDPQAALLMQLAENAQRVDLHPWERGAGYLDAHKLGAPWRLIAARCGVHVSSAQRDAAIAEGLTPEAIRALEQLPRQKFKVEGLLRIAALRDELGRPDPERQLAAIRRGGWRKPPPGTYDRALERRMVAAKLDALEVDMLPQLSPAERRAARAVIAYLRRPGPVLPFKWEDFDQ